MPCSATGIAGPATGGGPAIPVEFGGGARSSLQPVPAQHSRCLSVVLCELPLTDEKFSLARTRKRMTQAIFPLMRGWRPGGAAPVIF